MTLNYACIFGRDQARAVRRPARFADGAARSSEMFLGPDDHSLVDDPARGLERLQGDERPVRDRRQLLHPHPRPEPDDPARPVRQRHPVRLGRPPPLVDGDSTSARPAPAWEQSCMSSWPTLYPICRSITGDGVRETLRRDRRPRPARRPRDPDGNAGVRLDGPARVEHPRRIRRGRRRAARRRLPGVATSTSSATARRSTRACRLRSCGEHLTTIPERPDWIPYRTSYYREDWGFCLSHNALLALDGRRVRGPHRQHPRGRAPDLRRVLPRRARPRTRC